MVQQQVIVKRQLETTDKYVHFPIEENVLSCISVCTAGTTIYHFYCNYISYYFLHTQ